MSECVFLLTFFQVCCLDSMKPRAKDVLRLSIQHTMCASALATCTLPAAVATCLVLAIMKAFQSVEGVGFIL